MSTDHLSSVDITKKRDSYFYLFFTYLQNVWYFLILSLLIFIFYTISGCLHDSIVKETLQKQMVAKVVIILIDAWQEQFFYPRKAMQFLRQLTSNGQAVAFNAYVQTPTVTMPRIKVGSYFRFTF